MAWKSGVWAFDINCLNSSSNAAVEASWKWQTLCSWGVQGTGMRTVLWLTGPRRIRLVSELKLKNFTKNPSPLCFGGVSQVSKSQMRVMAPFELRKGCLSTAAQGSFACYHSHITKVSSHSWTAGAISQEGMQFEVSHHLQVSFRKDINAHCCICSGIPMTFWSRDVFNKILILP